MIQNIIAGYICLSIGAVIGYFLAAVLCVGSSKDSNKNKEG